jgi:hypothetical protein
VPVDQEGYIDIGKVRFEPIANFDLQTLSRQVKVQQQASLSACAASYAQSLNCLDCGSIDVRSLWWPGKHQPDIDVGLIANEREVMIEAWKVVQRHIAS